MNRRRVVFHEHNLCSDLDGQLFVGRIGEFGEVALNRSRKGVCRTFQLLQFLLVVAVCHVVMGGETNPSFAVGWSEIGYVALVEFLQHFACDIICTDMGKYVDEVRILLTVDVFEFYRDVRNLCQSTTAEEVRGGVVWLE